MAQIRSSRWWGGLASILATVFIATVAALTFSNWPAAGGRDLAYPTAIPSPSSDPASTQIVHPARLQAHRLTGSDVASISSDWLLVEYNTSAGAFAPETATVTPDHNTELPNPDLASVAGDGPAVWEIPGPTVLYVVDPSGSLYEGVDLGENPSLDLLAWLPDHHTVVIERPSSGGGSTLHELDILTGVESEAFAGPGGEASGRWVNPDVAVSTDGLGLVVQHGDGARSVSLINLEGAAVSEPVVKASLGMVVQSPDGTIVVTLEAAAKDAEADTTIVSYTAPGASVGPSPSPTLPPGVVPPPPIPAPSSSPSPSPSEGPRGYSRVVHGLPPGEESCEPLAWPTGRQLLVKCAHDDGTVVLYTLALATSTFVDVSTIDLGEDNLFFELNPAGIRIAGGRSVVSAVGTEVWQIAASEPNPTGLVWTESLLIQWGDIDVEARAGYGVDRVVARRVATGEVAYEVDAIRGAAGFGAILTAS